SDARPQIRDKDLLVVGGSDNQLISRWAAQLPIATDASRPRIQRREDASFFVDLLGGPGPLLDLRRAEDVLAHAKEVAAIEAIESPVSAGRAAVLVTATDPTRLPPLSAFLGYAESRALTGDVLLVAGNERWLFRLG